MSISFLFSVSALLILHMYMATRNLTTMDMGETSLKTMMYSKGEKIKNLEIIFGENKMFWLVPTKPMIKEEYLLL